jgi:DNA-binding CsgD family transcriptional regulator
MSIALGLPAPVHTVSQVPREGWEFSLHALNAVRYPAIAIDRLGFVLGANVAMAYVFDVDIRIKNKRLVIADRQARRCFEALIQCLAADFDAAGLPRVEPIVIRRNDKQPVIINLLPEPPAVRNPLPGAPAILTFVSLEPRPYPLVSLLIRVFSFTPAEARLAAALANGTSIADAAEVMSISSDTVRHQLKTVFLKTDTHRQSQLIALLARL